MASFKDWALRYVLAEDDSVLREVAESAAREIEKAHANSTVVGNWASSIQQWISGSRSDSQMDEGEEADSGDVIARAKALGFLAATLQALDRKSLKPDQIQRLASFFGSMFSYDHKAGITAATQALRELYGMKNFKPEVGVKILDSVTQINDDFRLQTAVTRLLIYQLVVDLIQNPDVSSELKQKYGASCDFAVNLLQLSQHERDPQNLMVWFKILRTILADYSPSPKITEECFNAFSAYFPITLRSAATPAGVTVDDLKGALRGCFSAHHCVASLAFPYLLQKLDQGDAVTVAVKVDILRTIKACVDKYDQPQDNVVPHVRKIWDSLKYEVRNGEVKETIDATLDVLRAISSTLQGLGAGSSTPQHLHDYVETVFQDSSDDLSNPTYTKQSGLLINTVVTSNDSAFVHRGQMFISLIEKNLRQPKSPSHRKDLVSLLNLYLKSRSDVVKSPSQDQPKENIEAGEEQLRAVCYEVYLPIWRDLSTKSETESINILKEVIQGMALLVSQRTYLPLSGGPTEQLLLAQATCDEICSLLSLRLVEILSLSANDLSNPTLQEEVVLALRAIVTHYTAGFSTLADKIMAEIHRRSWAAPSPYSLDTLRNVLTKLAFIGCSEIPADVSIEKAPVQPYSALQHFVKLGQSLLQLLPPASTILSDSRAGSIVISTVHCAMLNFHDACHARYGTEALEAQSGGDENWPEEFRQGAYGGLSDNPRSLREGDPQVYREFLKLCLWTVRTFYRQANEGGSNMFDDLLLSHVASMAAFVVRNLDEKLQKSCNLADEAFNFFLESKSAKKSIHEEFLTLGILEGLWPKAMTSLYAPDGVAQSYMCDIAGIDALPRRVSQVRAGIGAILSNKYQGGPGSADPESKTLKTVLRFWGEQLSKATSGSSTENEAFSTQNAITMHTIAGAFARMDRSAMELVPRLHEALASSSPNGRIVADSIQILVKDVAFLSTENHAIIKPIYRQWVYNYLARPLYEKALPPAKGEAVPRYTAAILAIVDHCPFNAYEADLPQLVRLLITTISKRPRDGAQLASPSSPSTELVAPVFSQTSTALHILLSILTSDPTAVTEHLNALIVGAIELHTAASWRNPPGTKPEESRSRPIDPHAAPTRRFALQLLGALPVKFEERYLLAHSPRMQLMLAAATGDPVRDVRKVAREARDNWAKVE